MRARHRSTSRSSCAVPISSTSSPPAATRRSPFPSSSASSRSWCTPPMTATATGARLLLALDELANVAPVASPRGHRLRGWRPRCPDPRLPPRSQPGPQPLGHLAPKASSRSFPPPWCCPASPTAPRSNCCATSRDANCHHPRASSATRKGRALGHSTSWVERDRVSVSELAQGRAGSRPGTRRQQPPPVGRADARLPRPALSRLPRTSLANGRSRAIARRHSSS